MRTLILITLALLGPFEAHSKLLHIIHTNDLHSMFQGTRTGLGGYARLKTVVDRLKADSKAKNIPTLYLDGGDFGEGSSFYFSNKGVDSLKALDILGVDVTVLGNHDYILGAKELKEQIKNSNLQAKLISANVASKRLMGLKKIMPDYVDYNLEGLKLRIFGLTTSEIHYQYPMRPLGWIKGSHSAGIKMAEKAQRDGVDFLLALTHIGHKNDIELVQNTFSVDLVVGGHSHTLVLGPAMTENMRGRLVPVLQAGAHSMYVGSLLMDVQPGGKSTVIDYKMFDITQDILEEATMKEFVDAAVVTREKYFKRKWDEVIGFSNIPLTGHINGQQTSRTSCWSRHVARMTKQVAKAHIGFQIDDFQGEHIAPGPITYGDIIDNFPRFRKWDAKSWKIKKSWVQGFVLKKILNAIAKSDFAKYVSVDGLEAKLEDGTIVAFDFSSHPTQSALINGKTISSLKYYKVALPSELPHAFLKVLNILSYVVFNNLRTVKNSDYWMLLEKYVKDYSPIGCDSNGIPLSNEN